MFLTEEIDQKNHVEGGKNLQRVIAKKNKEISHKNHTISLSNQLPLSLGFQVLSLTKTSSTELSLSTSRGHSTTHIHPHHHQLLPLHTSDSTTLSSEAVEVVSEAATRARRLPMPTPATIGHHFRRHHNRTSHLDLLYPTVLTGTSFIILQNLPCYCSLSLLHLNVGSELIHSPPTVTTWIAGWLG